MFPSRLLHALTRATRSPRAVLTLAAVLVPAAVHAQTLIDDGAEHAVPYEEKLPQDFTIPTSGSPDYLTFSVRGAAGGSAQAGSNCTSAGGKPVTATASFRIGTGTGELAPGGSVRFVIGQKGGSQSVGPSQAAKGAGGGGSAVLYRAPDPGAEWTLLCVGGAGGGAYQGNFLGGCVDSFKGGDAKVGTSGGNGGGADEGKGGTDGSEGGETWGGGGGGHSGGASPGADTGGKGYPSGGLGGTHSPTGGWGYGGGGAGSAGSGGGGGYSGGGGGDVARNGGGGGSYVSDWAVAKALNVTGSAGNGAGSYTFQNELGAPECASAPAILDGTFTGDTTNYLAPLMVDCAAQPVWGRAAWYSYTNDRLYPVEVTATTCNLITGFSSLAVFASCPGTPFDVPETCGVNCVPLLSQTATWSMLPGETRWIRVAAGSNFFVGGPYRLDVSSVPLPVVNDDCAAALDVPEGSHFTSLTGATPDPAPVTCGPQSHDDAWFEYTNTNEFDVRVEVSAQPLVPFAHSFSIEAIESCGGSVLECAVPDPIGTAVARWFVPAGETHRYRVASTTIANPGLFRLTVTSDTDFGAWTDLGGGTSGAFGPATLAGDGALCAAGTLELELTQVTPATPLVLGISGQSIPVPVFGGTVHTFPDPLPILSIADGAGGFDFSATMPPSLPSGTNLFFQVLALDATVPSGLVLSNGVRATTP